MIAKIDLRVCFTQTSVINLALLPEKLHSLAPSLSTQVSGPTSSYLKVIPVSSLLRTAMTRTFESWKPSTWTKSIYSRTWRPWSRPRCSSPSSRKTKSTWRSSSTLVSVSSRLIDPGIIGEIEVFIDFHYPQEQFENADQEHQRDCQWTCRKAAASASGRTAAHVNSRFRDMKKYGGHFQSSATRMTIRNYVRVSPGSRSSAKHSGSRSCCREMIRRDAHYAETLSQLGSELQLYRLHLKINPINFKSLKQRVSSSCASSRLTTRHRGLDFCETKRPH